MNEHTIGEWQVDEVRPWPNNPHVAGIIIKTKGGRQVCRIGALPELSEMKANARLIAAAPDLLEACQLAQEFLSGIGWSAWFGGTYQELEMSLEAAIAKATGGE